MAQTELTKEIVELCKDWMRLDEAMALCERLGVDNSTIKGIRDRRDYYWDLRKEKEAEFVSAELPLSHKQRHASIDG